MVPNSMAEKDRQHRALTNAKLDRRLGDQNARPDLYSFLIFIHVFPPTHISPSLSVAQATLDTPQGMTLGELRETSTILIPAGSETSATSMAGTFRFLLKNPSKLRALADQIRTRFTSERDITIQHVRERMPYLLAVIEESLRLLPPVAIAFSLYRIVPDEGATIAGRYVPGKALISVAPWAAFRSKRNFADLEAFVPERWLGEKECPERYRDDKRKVVQAFGVGPRGCIGKALAYAEVSLILTRILWNFDLELCDKDGLWGFEGKSEAWIIWDHQPSMVKLMPVKR